MCKTLTLNVCIVDKCAISLPSVKQTNAFNFIMTTKPDFQKGVRAILSGTAQWAQLTPKSGPNKMAGKYQCDLMIDETSLKLLESIGAYKFVQIKGVDGQPKYEVPAVRIKANNPPNVFDTHKATFNELIHNGSVLKTNCIVKAYEYNGKKGLSVWVNDVIVLNLAERGEGGGTPSDFFEGVKPTEPTFDAVQPNTSNADDDGFPF